jgi:hypothetical protein
MIHFWLLLLFILLHPFEAVAYIGPGMGAGTIAVVLGFIGAIFLALFAIIYYPIKRIVKKLKNKKKAEQ